MQIQTRKPEETYQFAKELGKQAQPGEIYALDGDLGAGKTVFCQGFAAGLGVSEIVNSPTFTILQEYRSGRLPLFHFDVYRLEEAEELEELGFEEYFFGEGICLIEWAGRIATVLPEETKHIRLERCPEEGPDIRLLTMQEGRREGPVTEQDRKPAEAAERKNL